MVAIIWRIPPSTIMEKKLGLNTRVSGSESSHKNRKYSVARGSPNKYRTSVAASGDTSFTKCLCPAVRSD